MKTTFDRVKEIVQDLLGEDVEGADATLESLNCDEFDHAEIMMCVEEDFDREIADDVWKAWRTVGDIVKTVEEALP